MAKVSVFLVDGFETVEALAVVDVLRRAKVNVETISLMDSKDVVSAQKIKVTADIMLWEASFSDSDLLFVPGGGGYKLINEDEKAKNIIRSFVEKDKYI
ncbi:MAG: DJ-1/PfpI family protein, partial [Lachnospiraceae bacterium]|nr:DJ-1/PfpI family protein [Lachnospiraceae bacterium]